MVIDLEDEGEDEAPNVDALTEQLSNMFAQN
jgi:hypothetical protein